LFEVYSTSVEGKMKKYLIVSVLLMTVLISQDVNAQTQTKTYFKFDIPLNADGTRVSYSPDYYGRMDRSPKNVTVVYYNDKEGYGYAYTVDTFEIKQATLTTATAADNVIKAAKDEIGVYFGEKILTRWYPEIKIEEYKVDEKGNIVTEKSEEYKIEVKKAVVCPTCGSFIFWYYDGLLDTRQVVTCPLGHKLITISYDALTVKEVVK
jgi:hypothetical protein